MIIYSKTVYLSSESAHLKQASALNKQEGNVGRAPCRIHLAAQSLQEDFLGFMINKNSWLKEQVNERIRWLRSFGVVEYMYQTFNPVGCRLKIVQKRQCKSKSLTLWQLQGAFWMWLVGVAVASVTLVLELFQAPTVGARAPSSTNSWC
nr:uncharacterized protein LOC123768578 [Procambarus clarkii]